MEQPKWEGKVTARLVKVSADQIWPLFQDFFGLNKWFPGLSICNGIHGTNGTPGCVRHCTGFSIPAENGISVPGWSHERLTAIDPVNKSFSYEMVDSNIGFQSYVSTVKILPDSGGEGCVVEWRFSVDPVAGMTLEDLVKKYNVGLQLMTKKMEESFEIS
ncbi:unnamed protein product [Cuscuta europaea]|uniref:Lachrymatory-factor synthase n=1 Tax=Cuscuta europaea TaxID=41803 RepID=A0A9P1E6I0_CUSEU|nr:unnamed protein product [Cuscuta europaea]